MGNVADLVLGDPDGLGQKIECIYARKARQYAVYSANRRVMVQFADASEGDLEHNQRKDMARIAPVRGEIDGLVDGWRRGISHSLLRITRSKSLISKANRYNRRTADALVVALEGDTALAGTILGEIKQDILDDRVAHARFDYMIAAIVTAIVLMFGAWLVTSTYQLVDDKNWAGRMGSVGCVVVLMAVLAGVGAFFARSVGEAAEDDDKKQKANSPGYKSALITATILALILLPVYAVLFDPNLARIGGGVYGSGLADAMSLWRAAAAGSVGAFFSIAIGIRQRTILPDLLQTSNLMDAALRISIGFLGAAVLEAMLLKGVITLKIAGIDLNGADVTTVLLSGFVAGFSERLVPDILAKTEGGAPAQRSAPIQPPAPASEKQPADDAAKANQEGGRGAVDPVPEQSNEDGCASDHALADEESTGDDELPASSGGVAPREGGLPQ